MKIPQIHGRHKIRDTRICRLWAEECKSVEDISEMFNITVRRVHQIIYTNREFLKLDVQHEKNKRIHTLNKLAKKKGETTRKDITDILEQLRKEIEGDKPTVDMSTTNNYQQVEVVIDDNSKISSALKSRVSPKRPK